MKGPRSGVLKSVRAAGPCAAVAMLGLCCLPQLGLLHPGGIRAVRHQGTKGLQSLLGTEASARQRETRVMRRAEEAVWETADEDMLNGMRPLPSEAVLFGSKIAFDVRLKKPLGLVFSDGPDGPGFGAGVGEVEEEGSARELLEEALAEGAKPRMWVQEGDEVLGVDGEPIDGYLRRLEELIDAGGDSVTITFTRSFRGPIKVAFPGGKPVTSRRTVPLYKMAGVAGYDCGCTCHDGRCGKCWHKDAVTGEVYNLNLHVPGVIPSVWLAAGEAGLRPNEGQFETWMPLKLVPAPEAFEAFQKEEEERERKRIEAQNNPQDQGWGGWF